jgi:GntR family transcriptional repressor for pyruvate dehydrogenase complex
MSTANVFTRDKPDPRVTAKLIARIKKMIAEGVITPGSRFPPERELAEVFKVNRASLRQVLKVLEIMGVLTQRVGDGTYLSKSAESILTEPIDFLILLDDLSRYELMETRILVEPELAARAAERATAQDMATLRNAILDLDRCKNNQERINADLAFHDAIFSASGNRICQLLFKGIHRTILSSMSQLAERAAVEVSANYHRRIYAAIREHNSELARTLMREHLEEALTLLKPHTKVQ